MRSLVFCKDCTSSQTFKSSHSINQQGLKHRAERHSYCAIATEKHVSARAKNETGSYHHVRPAILQVCPQSEYDHLWSLPLGLGTLVARAISFQRTGSLSHLSSARVALRLVLLCEFGTCYKIGDQSSSGVLVARLFIAQLNVECSQMLQQDPSPQPSSRYRPFLNPQALDV